MYPEALPGEGGAHDPAVLDPEGRRVMLTFDASAWLDLPRDFTDDELSDLIATVVDLLDERVLDPSVGTTRTEEGTQVRVSMSFDTDDQWAAARQAVAVLRDVFDQLCLRLRRAGLLSPPLRIARKAHDPMR